MTDDAPKFPRETGSRSEHNITGMFLAWDEGQPDYLGCVGLGDAIALFTTQEKIDQARAELPFNGTEIKLVSDQEEFLREVPGSIPIVIDPHLSETGTLLLTLLKRD